MRIATKMATVAGLTVVVALVIACGRPVTPRQPTKQNSGSRVRVTRAEHGERWPLTVEEGEVECLPGGVFVFHHGGKTYALNGMAEGKGYADIRPIWRDDPTQPGLKISIGPLISAANSACKK